MHKRIRSREAKVANNILNPHQDVVQGFHPKYLRPPLPSPVTIRRRPVVLLLLPESKHFRLLV